MSEEHEVYLINKVNELMDKLAAERAKVKDLENRDAYNQAYINNQADMIKTLQTQNAVMMSALEKIATTAFQQYNGNKLFVSEHDSGYSLGIADGHRLAAQWAHEAIEAARAAGVEV